jgi:lipopolysaccharide transport system permease protein
LSKASNPFRARFSEAQVRAVGPSRLLLECTLENTSNVAWAEQAVGERVAGPIRFGYQVFNAQTGQLVLDGTRSSLNGDFRPGARFPVRADIQLPAEPGRYRVVVSPIQEQVAWFYERGSEFLEIEVSSQAEQLAIEQVRRMTRVRRAAQRLAQLLVRSFWYPLRTFARHRVLMLSMVRRDLQGRYRGSMVGAWWTLVQPLLLMIAYYFVFAVVLRVRFEAEQGTGGFVFYFLCGMLPWLAFSEAVGRSPNIVIEHSNFVKRVIFPLEILPVNLTLTGLATEGFALLVFLAALVSLGPGLHWTAAYFPLVLVPQLLLTAGLCWFLAALGVFLRDTGQVMGLVLTVWFFATPIVYPASALPLDWLWLFQLNPMYTIVAAYRDIFLEHRPPDAAPLATLWAASIAMFWFGYSWFYKVKKSFADLI